MYQLDPGSETSLKDLITFILKHQWWCDCVDHKMEHVAMNFQRDGTQQAHRDATWFRVKNLEVYIEVY